jgi:hypothetical protein
MNISKVWPETFEKSAGIKLYLDVNEVKNLLDDLEIITLDLEGARTYSGQYFVEDLKERAKKNQAFEIVMQGRFIKELIYEITVMFNSYSGKPITHLLLSHLQYFIMSDNMKKHRSLSLYHY